MRASIPRPAVNYLNTPLPAPSIPARRTWVEYLSEAREFTFISPHLCSARKQDIHGTIAGDACVRHSAMHTAVTIAVKTEITHISRGGRPQKQAGNLETKLTSWDSAQWMPQLCHRPHVGEPSGARGSRGVITEDLQI